jgi:trans-aconitate methyltransferase
MIDKDGVVGVNPEKTDAQIDDKGSKFEMFFDAPYNEIKTVLKERIKPEQRIVDIGANIGNLEDYLDTLNIPLDVTCVDSDNEVLDKLKTKQFKNIKVETDTVDANEFIEGYAAQDVDTALLNATLHEINNPTAQRKYLEHFFERLSAMLKQGGQVIVGDYYYPDEVTDEEVASFIEYQLKAINHADTRDKFVKPGLLASVAQEKGFLAEGQKEIRAVKEIDRRYYVAVFRKQ